MIQKSSLVFGLVLATLFGIYLSIDSKIDALYAGTHFAVILLALVHIAHVKKFNLGLSFSFFALFFFGIIPLFEYKLGVAYNGTRLPRDSSYLFAAVLTLLSSLSFYAGYGWSRRGSTMSLRSLLPVQFETARHRQAVGLTAIASVVGLALFVAAHYGFDYKSLFFRGFAEESEDNAFGYSFITYFVRPLLFNVLFLAMMTRRQSNPRSRLPIYFLLVISMIFVSPIGIPRSLAGALYIPLLVIVFIPSLNSKTAVLCVIVFAILLAAPVFDLFREMQGDQALELAANFNADYLFAGHFDAFYNLAQVIDLHYYSAGWQTIGALLFWVPRAFWPAKPVGTSFNFADYAGFRSSNVSFPLTADLYVDYGIAGVIAGLFLLGVVYRRVDALLAKPQVPGSLTSYLFAMAHLELAILGIYLLRGNFLSSFAFTMGVALTFAVILAATKATRAYGMSRVAPARETPL